MSPFNADQQFPTFKPIVLSITKWSWRFIKKTYKYTLGLILILVLADVIATLILGQLLKEDIAALKAKGEPVSMADLKGPTIPDSDNAAVLYSKAFELISTPQTKKDMDVVGRVVHQYYRDEDPSLWRQAAAILPRYRNALQLAEEASSRPKCRFAADWEAGTGASVAYRSKMWDIVDLAAASVLVAAKSGVTEDTIKSVELLSRTSNALKDEPALITHYTRMTITERLTGSVEDLVRYGSISDSQAKRLFDRLAHIEMGTGTKNAMRTETALGIWVFDQVYAGTHPVRATLDGG